jgi:GTP-binding protein HflX
VEKAILVTLMFADRSDGWLAKDSSRELGELAKSAGAKAVSELTFTMKAPQSRMFMGPGQADEIRREAERVEADVVILNRDISGTQQRNLEELVGCKTIDRTQLILDIFASRARSNEGKVQVELAQLTYLMPRLAGKGIYLTRQGGGIGTRGPGEQKIETDRRRLRDKIVFLKGQLAQMETRRESYRERRREHDLPVVALVGYTNAGKSTLFNALTGSGVIAKDQLFSTLDSTVRAFELPGAPQRVMLVDTVGFLHLLPHHLIDAFKATLEEVMSADLLVHVVDISDPNAITLERSVKSILEEMGASEKTLLTVLNKSDRLTADERTALKATWSGGIWVSAATGDGFAALGKKIAGNLKSFCKEYRFVIPAGSAQLIHAVYEQGKVLSRKDDGLTVTLRAALPEAAGDAIRTRVRALTKK